MIASLQEGGVGVSGSAHEASLEQLRLEKEALRAELETARLQGEGLRAELHETEEQHSQEMAQLSEQVSREEDSFLPPCGIFIEGPTKGHTLRSKRTHIHKAWF